MQAEQQPASKKSGSKKEKAQPVQNIVVEENAEDVDNAPVVSVDDLRLPEATILKLMKEAVCSLKNTLSHYVYHQGVFSTYSYQKTPSSQGKSRKPCAAFRPFLRSSSLISKVFLLCVPCFFFRRQSGYEWILKTMPSFFVLFIL